MIGAARATIVDDDGSWSRCQSVLRTDLGGLNVIGLSWAWTFLWFWWITTENLEKEKLRLDRAWPPTVQSCYCKYHCKIWIL